MRVHEATREAATKITNSHLSKEAELTKHPGTDYIKHGDISLQNYAGKYSLSNFGVKSSAIFELLHT